MKMKIFAYTGLNRGAGLNRRPGYAALSTPYREWTAWACI